MFDGSGRDFGRFAPGKGVHPGHELGESEGLDEIIVGPGVEALDAIVDAAERGQEKDGRFDLR